MEVLQKYIGQGRTNGTEQFKKVNIKKSRKTMLRDHVPRKTGNSYSFLVTFTS